MAALSVHCPRQMPTRSSTSSPPSLAPKYHPHTLSQCHKGLPRQVSLSPLRIKAPRVQNTSRLPVEATTVLPLSPPPTSSPVPLDRNNQLQVLSQLVDDAMYNTTIDAIADTLDTTIEQLCALKLQHHQDQQPAKELPVPSSFGEGYPIHSPTHNPTNPALAALLLRVGSDNLVSFDYDTLVGYDLDNTTLLSLFPVPPREPNATLEGYDTSSYPSPSSASSLASFHLSALTSSSLSHSSDRDSTNSLLSTISSGSTASMSSVSTSCTTASLSESDDGHDPTDYPHCSPCSSMAAVNNSPSSYNDDDAELTIAAAAAFAGAASEIEKSTSKGGLVKKSSSKRRRQKLSMKRHWEVPQQACVIPPIFDKRYFEDDRAEIPKSIKAMEEERVRARQEEEEEAKRRRQQHLQQQTQRQQETNNVATVGVTTTRDGGKDGSMGTKSVLSSQQLQVASHHTLASNLRPLSPSKSTGSSPNFPSWRQRRHPFPQDHTFVRSKSPVSSPTDSAVTAIANTNNTVADMAASSASSSPTSPQPQSWETQEKLINNISSRVSAMEASMRAATRVLEQRAQWLERMDKQANSANDSEEDEVRETMAPLRRVPLPRSNTSPCLAGVNPAFASSIPAVPNMGTHHYGLMVIEPPARTSSIRTVKSDHSATKPYPPTIPSWARRFEADEHQLFHHANNSTGNLSDDGRFGLSNGDDEIITRGDDEAARRKRRWRRNTEDRHAEWMETIKAGRFGQDDPRGWGNRFQRLKQHFQTVTGRPMTSEVPWTMAVDPMTAATEAAMDLHREEAQQYSKSDNEGSPDSFGALKLSGSHRIPKGKSPRQWFHSNSLRVAKDPSRADLPHLSKLW
ncbi:hypothetical protein BGZ73_004219 [Actinomortierella ambigua]|nr:hypothetical protein BGZ73_004219 [Actinomortierella ambigua]